MIREVINVQRVSIASNWINLEKLKLDSLALMNLLQVFSLSIPVSLVFAPGQVLGYPDAGNSGPTWYPLYCGGEGVVD